MGAPALAPAISAPAEPSKLLGRTTRQSVHPPGVLLSITSRLGGENAPPARYGERFPERVVRLRTGSVNEHFWYRKAGWLGQSPTTIGADVQGTVSFGSPRGRIIALALQHV